MNALKIKFLIFKSFENDANTSRTYIFFIFCILKLIRKIRDKKLGYDMKDKLKQHKKQFKVNLA